MVRRGRRWILLKQIHHDLHRFLELRVVSLAQRLPDHVFVVMGKGPRSIRVRLTVTIR